jgi:hypothetical protein
MLNSPDYEQYANIEHFQSAPEESPDMGLNNGHITEQQMAAAQRVLDQAQAQANAQKEETQVGDNNNVNNICDTIREAADQCEARKMRMNEEQVSVDETQSYDGQPQVGNEEPQVGNEEPQVGVDETQSGDGPVIEGFQSNNADASANGNNMNLLLRGVLFACLFYLLSHPETLQFVSKNIKQLNVTNAHVLMSVAFIGCYMLLTRYV